MKTKRVDIITAAQEIEAALNTPVALEGTGDTRTVTVPHDAPLFKIKVDADMTFTTPTISRNGQPAKFFRLPTGVAVTELLLETGYYEVVEEASAFTLAPKGKKLIGDAQPSHVLAPYSFSNADGNDKVGTMINRAGQSASLGDSRSGNTIHFIPPAGYYDGVDDTVYGFDTDLVADNLKVGANLWGLAGTFTSDATATDPSHIVSGYTAYANGVKITGNAQKLTLGGAGDTTIAQSTAIKYRFDGAYSKQKEIRINEAGTYKVTFNLYCAGVGPVYGQIYKNGQAIGTARSTTNDQPVEFTETHTFAANDLVQLYLKGRQWGPEEYDGAYSSLLKVGRAITNNLSYLATVTL